MLCGTGFFGKLPIHQDFIQVNAAFPEVQQLDQWFQEGIQLMKRRADMKWPEDFEQGEPWEFLYSPPGAQRSLVGLYSPSRDGGGRHYPFLVFRWIDRTSYAWPLMLIPVAVAEFLVTARTFAKSDLAALTMPQLRDRIAEMPVGVADLEGSRNNYHNFLQTKTSRGFWADLFGDFESTRKYLFYRNLLRALEPLRRHGEAQRSPGLMFPLLAFEKTENYDIALWVDLMQRLLKQEIPGAVCFWRREVRLDEPSLFFHVAMPSPKAFSYLVRPDLDMDGRFDLAPKTDEPLERVLLRVGHSRRKLLERPELPLSLFLDVAGSLEG